MTEETLCSTVPFAREHPYTQRGPRYVLTRTLPGGEEKTSTAKWGRKIQAAKEAARSHRDNTAGAFGWQRVCDALMTADHGVTVGPFDGYCYRIDRK